MSYTMLNPAEAESATPPEVQSNSEVAAILQKVANGLGDIIGPAMGKGVQLSQTDTLRSNNRRYLISNDRWLLSEAYVEHGLVQTIVDVPVDDALRGGFDIKTKQLDPYEIEALQAHWEEMNASVDLGTALKWKRLYGGGAVIMMTGQDAETPFDITKITEDEPIGFRAVDLWELSDSFAGTNPEEERSIKPGDKKFYLNTAFDYFHFYGQKIHKSRVLTLKGKTAPSIVRPRLRGWGFSVLETLVRSINQYLKSNNLAFEVLDEFKLDIFRIKGFNQSLVTAAGQDKILRRIAMANQQKNFQNALSMDTEDEYVQKQLSFAGIADVMKEIRMQVASDMRMPMTKLFGISASGLNASGEEDIEVYNGMVDSEVRVPARHPQIQMVKILCQQKFGMIPGDLTLGYRPLRILGAVEEEGVKTSKFARVVSAKNEGIMSPQEAGEACNRDNLLPVQVEVSELSDEVI